MYFDIAPNVKKNKNKKTVHFSEEKSFKCWQKVQNHKDSSFIIVEANFTRQNYLSVHST